MSPLPLPLSLLSLSLLPSACPSRHRPPLPTPVLAHASSRSSCPLPPPTLAAAASQPVPLGRIVTPGTRRPDQSSDDTTMTLEIKTWFDALAPNVTKHMDEVKAYVDNVDARLSNIKHGGSREDIDNDIHNVTDHWKKFHKFSDWPESSPSIIDPKQSKSMTIEVPITPIGGAPTTTTPTPSALTPKLPTILFLQIHLWGLRMELPQSPSRTPIPRPRPR